MKHHLRTSRKLNDILTGFSENLGTHFLTLDHSSFGSYFCKRHYNVSFLTLLLLAYIYFIFSWLASHLVTARRATTGMVKTPFAIPICV